MFWLLLCLCLEQTTKSTTYLFLKSVFHDGKTVNYHTGQLTRKLRMLSYPITFRNNFCTHGQHTLHTHFEQLQHFILVLFDWLIRNLFFYGVTCLSSSLNAFQMQYMESLHAWKFLFGEHSFSASLIIKSTGANLWPNNITKNANLHLR